MLISSVYMNHAQNTYSCDERIFYARLTLDPVFNKMETVLCDETGTSEYACISIELCIYSKCLYLMTEKVEI